MTDDLTLVVNINAIAGWTSVRVTRGIERCPSDFEIALTEGNQGLATLNVKPGDRCQVMLGSDVVITGFVDSHQGTVSGGLHEVRITGRGKCQDLVDCAAEWESGQISGANALEIAQRLADAYGIEVAAAAEQDNLPRIPRINLILGETAYEIIERVCRFRGLLAYEQPDGSLFLSQAGTKEAASGFDQGVNVETATLDVSMASRFSEYRALLQSMDRTGELGGAGNLQYVAFDNGVLRNRKMVIIAEYGDSGADVCKQRALWEAARRLGRSSRVTLSTDSWRDSAGKLWEPNTRVPLSLPSLGLAESTWLISEVTYRRDENGTHADLTIMPPAAFLPQPVLLIPGIAELGQTPQAPRPIGVAP